MLRLQLCRYDLEGVLGKVRHGRKDWTLTSQCSYWSTIGYIPQLDVSRPTARYQDLAIGRESHLGDGPIIANLRPKFSESLQTDVDGTNDSVDTKLGAYLDFGKNLLANVDDAPEGYFAV